LYMGLPEGAASTLKYVDIFKTYIQFVILLGTFVGEYDEL